MVHLKKILVPVDLSPRSLGAARCPVWAGVDGFPPLTQRPVRTVFYGLSRGPRAAAVLRWAADLARQFRASLLVIHSSRTLESAPRIPVKGRGGCG